MAGHEVLPDIPWPRWGTVGGGRPRGLGPWVVASGVLLAVYLGLLLVAGAISALTILFIVFVAERGRADLGAFWKRPLDHATQLLSELVILAVAVVGVVGVGFVLVALWRVLVGADGYSGVLGAPWKRGAWRRRWLAFEESSQLFTTSQIEQAERNPEFHLDVGAVLGLLDLETTPRWPQQHPTTFEYKLDEALTLPSIRPEERHASARRYLQALLLHRFARWTNARGAAVTGRTEAGVVHLRVVEQREHVVVLLPVFVRVEPSGTFITVRVIGGVLWWLHASKLRDGSHDKGDFARVVSRAVRLAAPRWRRADRTDVVRRAARFLRPRGGYADVFLQWWSPDDGHCTDAMAVVRCREQSWPQLNDATVSAVASELKLVRNLVDGVNHDFRLCFVDQYESVS